MKKFLIVLLALLLLCAHCALAESAPADGLYTIGVSSNAKMFKIVDCILRVEDGRMTAVLTMSGSGYGYLYQGTSAEADSVSEQSWTPYFEDDNGRHRFAIEIPYLDAELPMAGWSIRYEKWYDRTLQFFSNTLKPYKEIASDGVYSGVLRSDTELDGAACILRSQNGSMTVEAEGLEIELSSLDTRVPCEGGWLILDSASLSEYVVSTENGSYRAQAETDSGLLKFTSCILKVENGEMTAELTAKNSQYDYLYIGKAADATANEGAWIPACENADGTATYILPVASLDNEISIATHSRKKQIWYDRSVFISSDSLERIDEAPEAEAMSADAQATELEAPDGFSFSGGSGKITITCEGICRLDDQITAVIVFSSPNYSKLSVDGVDYAPIRQDDDSTAFEIPVRLNAAMKITGLTTAMSKAHEVEYEIRIEKDDVQDQTAIAGLKYESSMEVKYATGFSVDYYEGGYTLIDVIGDCQYLLIPEGMPIPEGLDENIKPLQQPLDNIYLTATSAMAFFDRLDALDSIRLSGTKASGWYIENAADAMERGEILFAGKYSEPDYELLLREGCDLAIESTMILHTPKVMEMIELLDIPVFIERASYETHPLGRTEWIKVYGALLDKEEEAQAFFDSQAGVLDEFADAENTGRTVAFFYLASDGSVNVRASADYVPAMIEIAGGKYIFEDISDPESKRSTLSISMEDFYSAAVDADFLVYNAAIDDPVYTIDELLAKNALFADFKAIKNGDVWCTGKYLFQATDIMGSLIADLNHMLTGQGDMSFLYKLA